MIEISSIQKSDLTDTSKIKGATGIILTFCSELGLKALQDRFTNCEPSDHPQDKKTWLASFVVAVQLEPIVVKDLVNKSAFLPHNYS